MCSQLPRKYPEDKAYRFNFATTRTAGKGAQRRQEQIPPLQFFRPQVYQVQLAERTITSEIMKCPRYRHTLEVSMPPLIFSKHQSAYSTPRRRVRVIRGKHSSRKERYLRLVLPYPKSTAQRECSSSSPLRPAFSIHAANERRWPLHSPHRIAGSLECTSCDATTRNAYRQCLTF